MSEIIPTGGERPHRAQAEHMLACVGGPGYSETLDALESALLSRKDETITERENILLKYIERLCQRLKIERGIA